MLSFFTRLQHNRKGFTLIELMVVVVILGILAGAAIMTLGGGQDEQAKLSRAKSDISTLISALEFYRLDVGKYPSDTDGLAALKTQPASGADGWNGPYIKSIPDDPYAAADTPYTYDLADDGKTYTITAAGPSSGAVTSENL